MFSPLVCTTHMEGLQPSIGHKSSAPDSGSVAVLQSAAYKVKTLLPFTSKTMAHKLTVICQHRWESKQSFNVPRHDITLFQVWVFLGLSSQSLSYGTDWQSKPPKPKINTRNLNTNSTNPNNYTLQNQTSPGLVASYDIPKGHRSDIFWEKTTASRAHKGSTGTRC